jgi:hypothetical protein
MGQLDEAQQKSPVHRLQPRLLTGDYMFAAVDGRLPNLFNILVGSSSERPSPFLAHPPSRALEETRNRGADRPGPTKDGERA